MVGLMPDWSNTDFSKVKAIINPQKKPHFQWLFFISYFVLS